LVSHTNQHHSCSSSLVRISGRYYGQYTAAAVSRRRKLRALLRAVREAVELV
jgi:hypothetical protein